MKVIHYGYKKTQDNDRYIVQTVPMMRKKNKHIHERIQIPFKSFCSVFIRVISYMGYNKKQTTNKKTITQLS